MTAWYIDFDYVQHNQIAIHILPFFQKEHSTSIRVSKESLKLLRALAGDDSVKNKILKDRGALLLDEIINIHKVKCESPL